MARLHSLVFRGEYKEGDYVNSSAVMALMRPYYKLVGDPDKRVVDAEFAEGYDESAWEYYRGPGIVVRTVGAASATGRHHHFDGVLVDYRKYNTTIDLLGEDHVGNRPAWRLLATLEDGFQSEILIDQETYLTIADRKAAPIHAFGERVSSETRYSDFRSVNGVLFSFESKEVEIATGKVLNEFRTLSIVANHPYDSSVFSPPDFKRTPIQRWTESLYAMRDDVTAVMWSYRAFRREHPGIDTHDAAQVAGYQMVKMNALPAATAILSANVNDYPAVAAAHFGLGRAYKTAGKSGEAREEFQRALVLDPKFTRAADALKALP